MLRTRLHTFCNARRGLFQLKNARFASSLTAPEPSPGIFDGLFNKSKLERVTMDLPYPGLPTLEPKPLTAHSTSVSTLPNGIRVVTQDSDQPIASVGAFLDAGSRYENPANNGISHFLEFIAFKATQDRSSFRLVREMLKLGVNVVCSTSRETTVFAADALRTYTPAMVHTLGDVIQNPLFDPQELAQAYEEYAEQAADKDMSPDIQLMEAIHAAAYHNNTVGLPSYNTSNVQHFTQEILQEHIKSMFTADKIVVSGVGVEHASFLELVEQEFAGLSKGTSPEVEKAKYTGGDVRIAKTDEPLTHVAVAFETASWHSADLVPMCVLQMMMGGGGSFSAGGPGKGMYSRLYQNVLSQHNWVESANSFNSIFNDSAIFGIHGMSAPQSAGSLVDVMCNEFVRMAGQVTDAELSRAKAQLQSSVNMQLETRSLQLEDLGRQMLAYNKIQTSADLCAKIAAVTPADIQRVAQSMLKTTPSVSAYGNLSYLPRYDEISKRFG